MDATRLLPAHEPDRDSPAHETSAAAILFLQLADHGAGQIINQRYRIERLLGKGGFGIVFAARDLILDLPVALKFLHPKSTCNPRRFMRVKREVALARKLNDERLVKVHALEEYGSISFLVMELVAGESLQSVLTRQGKIAWPELERLARQIVAALGVLHNQGIIHRDLKPGNIMLLPAGAIKVLDFGLAKEIEDTEKTSSLGEIVGSPLYISPEQVHNRKVDQRSDIYQLGLLLYTALAGSHPFMNDSTAKILLNQLHETPPQLKDPAIPRHALHIINRCLQKEPKRRFANMAEISKLLEKGRLAWWQPLLPRFTHGRVFKAALTALLLIILGLLTLFYSSPHMARIAFSGSALSAYNTLGRRLWTKDFSPRVIDHAYITLNQQNYSINAPNTTKETHLLAGNYAIAILSHPQRNALSAEISISDASHNVQLLYIDRKGNFSSIETTSSAYDLPPIFSLVRFTALGITPKREIESLLLLNHAQTFFPTKLVYLRGLDHFVFSNPGRFSIIGKPFQRETNQPNNFLILGQNNLVSHLSFFSEIMFPNAESPLNSEIHAIPNLEIEAGSNNLDSLIFFASQCHQIKENRWQKDGVLVFSNSNAGQTITINRTGDLTLAEAGSVRHFHDERGTLAKVYSLINVAYQQNMQFKNPGKALQTLAIACNAGVENPFLQSALLYLRGALECRLALFDQASGSLRKALDLYPQNPDAPQKLLEIEFLKGHSGAETGKIENEFQSTVHAWGLGLTGNALFKSYCYLHSGQISRAKEIINQANFPQDQSYFTITQGIFAIFSGDYMTARAVLAKDDATSHTPFELAEFRLFYGRALILADQELEKARFIFDDLANHSLSHGHKAEISRCYLLAKAGHAKEAQELAKPAFDKLLDWAKGDFDTRLWLFYDACIYGRTMDLCGDRKEARRGFLACIAANPHTGLAKQARELINQPWFTKIK